MMSVSNLKEDQSQQYDDIQKVLLDKGSLHFLIHTMCSTESKILYVSEGLVDFLGYSSKELIGESITILQEFHDPYSDHLGSALRCGHELVTDVVNKGRDGTQHAAKVFLLT